MQKYGFDDARNVLERASARETAARVAAGAVAKRLLAAARHRDRLPRDPARPGARRHRAPARAGRAARRSTPRRCAAPTPTPRRRSSPRSRPRRRTATRSAAWSRCSPTACPSGLGSHVHWDRKLDGLLAQALMSIQAVKGVEIGDGFDVAGRPGERGPRPDRVGRRGRRLPPHELAAPAALEGGMSTGEVLVAHVAMKPLATLNRPVLPTVDTATKEAKTSFKERTDVTAVPAMGVVAEAMAALVLADEALRKFGGDSMRELVRNHEGFAAPGRTTRAVAEVGAAPELDPEATPAQLGRDPGLRRRRRRTRRRRPATTAPGPAVNRRCPDRPGHVVLVGMMGVGKTTVGPTRGRRLGRPFVDSDAVIEARTGRTVAGDLRDRRRAGVPRSRGRGAGRRPRRRRSPAVIAAAGGVVLDPGNRELLRRAGTVVWLRAPVEVLVERVVTGRPPPAARRGPAGTLRPPGGRRERPLRRGRRPRRRRRPVARRRGRRRASLAAVAEREAAS